MNNHKGVDKCIEKIIAFETEHCSFIRLVIYIYNKMDLFEKSGGFNRR